MPGKVSINMSHYVDRMVKKFPQENLKGALVASGWNKNLFKVQHDSAPLEKEQAELFHTMTMQDCFFASMVIQIYFTSNSLPNNMGTKT